MGQHIYDVLACKIEHVHASYSLTGKVCTTIIDNGSNFVKAFAVYCIAGLFPYVGANFPEWSAFSFSRNFLNLEIHDTKNREHM